MVDFKPEDVGVPGLRYRMLVVGQVVLFSSAPIHLRLVIPESHSLLSCAFHQAVSVLKHKEINMTAYTPPDPRRCGEHRGRKPDVPFPILQDLWSSVLSFSVHPSEGAATLFALWPSEEEKKPKPALLCVISQQELCSSWNLELGLPSLIPYHLLEAASLS